VSCGDLDQQVFAQKHKPDGISSFGQADQGISKLYVVLGQFRGQGIDETCHASGKTSGAAMHAFAIEAFGLLVGVAEMQQRALIVLGKIREPQLRNKAGNERLRLRPKPCGAKIDSYPALPANDGEHAPAKPRTCFK
jgi:hypothetical protein